MLERALASYDVQVLCEARVAGVEPRRITVTTPEGDHELADLSYAHVVSPYRAPDRIVRSDLAGATQAGLVDVDPFTLRHLRHPAIWSLGDVADLGIKPSGGALREQVKVLAHNIAAAETALGCSTTTDTPSCRAPSLDTSSCSWRWTATDGRHRPCPSLTSVRPRQTTGLGRPLRSAADLLQAHPAWQCLTGGGRPAWRWRRSPWTPGPGVDAQQDPPGLPRRDGPLTSAGDVQGLELF